MSLTKFLNEKTAFLDYKKRSSKSWKIDIFAKGLTHGFGPKMAIFSTFFFGSIGQENVSYEILERENAFLRYKKKKFKKSKNWHFSKRVNSWLWSKNVHFFKFFFLGNIGQENVFYDILETKKAFLGYKNNKLKTSRKTDIFPKGLTHGFCPKVAIFSTFFFRQYRPGKRLLWCSRTKKRLSRLKKEEV